eukprot:3455244-Prymnesium_polylepis.1
MVKNFAANYPELLLLPWEFQRAMGVLHHGMPADVEYTFISHQVWRLPVKVQCTPDAHTHGHLPGEG